MTIYEWMTDHIRHRVRQVNPALLEIGAHKGGDTELFLKLFDKPVITAFEPEPRCLSALLAKNLPVTVVPAAVGSLDGVTWLYQCAGGSDGQWSSSSSIREPTGHLTVYPDITFPARVRVPVVKLDSYFTDDPAFDFIWCDVQGAEQDVIAGGRYTLSRASWCYMEYSDRELYKGQVNLVALERLMKPLGFVRAAVFHDGNVLFCNKR